MEYRPGSSRKQVGLPLRKEDGKQNCDPKGSLRAYVWEGYILMG